MHQARIEIGDLSLRSEIGRKIQLSYKYKINKLQASFSPYLNDIENFIYIIPTRCASPLCHNTSSQSDAFSAVYHTSDSHEAYP